jgi:hypothetical protein
MSLIDNLKVGTIKSEAQGVEYLITKIDSENIYFQRKDAENQDEEIIKKSKIEDIIAFKEKGNAINTVTIKDFVSGQQAPVLAILRECKII